MDQDRKGPEPGKTVDGGRWREKAVFVLFCFVGGGSQAVWGCGLRTGGFGGDAGGVWCVYVWMDGDRGGREEREGEEKAGKGGEEVGRHGMETQRTGWVSEPELRSGNLIARAFRLGIGCRV